MFWILYKLPIIGFKYCLPYLDMWLYPEKDSVPFDMRRCSYQEYLDKYGDTFFLYCIRRHLLINKTQTIYVRPLAHDVKPGQVQWRKKQKIFNLLRTETYCIVLQNELHKSLYETSLGLLLVKCFVKFFFFSEKKLYHHASASSWSSEKSPKFRIISSYLSMSCHLDSVGNQGDTYIAWLPRHVLSHEYKCVHIHRCLGNSWRWLLNKEVQRLIRRTRCKCQNGK